MSGCSEALQSTSSKSKHTHASSGIDTCSSSTTSWISKTPPALALSPLPGGSTRGSRNSAGVSAARLTGELGGVSSLTRALGTRPSGSFSDTLFWAGVLGVAGADRALRGLRKPSVSATSSARSGSSWSRSGGVVGTYPSDSSSPAVSNPPSGCGTTSSAGRLNLEDLLSRNFLIEGHLLKWPCFTDHRREKLYRREKCFVKIYLHTPCTVGRTYWPWKFYIWPWKGHLAVKRAFGREKASIHGNDHVFTWSFPCIYIYVYIANIICKYFLII